MEGVVLVYFMSGPLRILEMKSLLLWASQDHADEVGVFDVAVKVGHGLCELEGVVDLLVAQLVSHAGEDVHQLGVGHEALALAVEGLEGLVEVVEGAGVLLLLHLGVDGEELLQLVALLAHLLGTAVLLDGLLGGVESQAVQHRAGLEGVDLTVTAIPEVEELEHVLDLFDLVS